MKNTYLTLAIIGFVLPNVLVIQESMDSGNIMLYMDPLATFSDMFANRISSIFAIDLLFAVVVFFVWSWMEAKKHKLKGLVYVWISTMLFGLAGAFPLFLYIRERNLGREV